MELTHQQRMAREEEWYESTRDVWAHPLNRWPFGSQLRHVVAYDIARYNLLWTAKRLVDEPKDVLLAPCGTGGEAGGIHMIWPGASISGIDISETAVERATLKNALQGDIQQMPFPDDSFDVLMATLFFHHVATEGYAPYLREMRRVLRPGGVLITLEPSKHHPLFLITRPLYHVFPSASAQVEHEGPISIPELCESLRANGFSRTEDFSCSFGHNRLPLPATLLLNTLRNVRQLRHFAWMCGVIAWKAH